jgi:mono/diheme cytochrome c family protein
VSLAICYDSEMVPRNILPLLVLGALAACSAKAPVDPAVPSATSTPGTADAAQTGERLYSGSCVPCHQQSGAGIPGVYPSLAGSPVVVGDPAALALWVIKGQRPLSMPQGRYATQMLQFGWMKPADAAALFTYLRSNFGNSAPPVDAATVAKALGQ